MPDTMFKIVKTAAMANSIVPTATPTGPNVAMSEATANVNAPCVRIARKVNVVVKDNKDV